MILYSLMVAAINPTDGNVYIYSREYDLSSFGFFARNTVKESFKFLCRESVPVVSKTKGTRHTVQHEDKYVVHILVSSYDNLAVYAFCDSDYPRRIAYKCLEECMEKFNAKVKDSWQQHLKDENIDFGVLPGLLKSYADPSKFNKLVMAQKNADEVQVILHDTIKKLLDQAQDLDKLVEKSKDLSAQSKMFYKNTKAMNKSCCNIF
jgi:synaptobrevin family protein YKT6